MLVVPVAAHQWSWPAGTTSMYLSISLTLCSISFSAEIGSFISPPLPVTPISPLTLYLLLFRIYSPLLSYLMLQNGWDDGFCGGGREQRDPVLYPSQKNWLNTSQHCGRWEPHSSTPNSLLPSTVKCPSALEPSRDMVYQEKNQETSSRMWSCSPHSELGASPCSKSTGCPLPSEQLGCHSCHGTVPPGSGMPTAPHLSPFQEALGCAGFRAARHKERLCEAPSYIGIFHHANATLQLALGSLLPTH